MYPKTFFEDPTILPNVGACFVAMPFAENFDVVYQAIKQALEGPTLRLSCTRTDELLGGGHIIEDILRGIGESEIIVVDVSGQNPNVFYELGIAHMVKSVEQVILISQDIDSVPFDLRAFRHILYKTTEDGLSKLRISLEDAVRPIVKGVHRIDVDSSCVGQLAYKIMGRDHYHYGFKVLDGGFGYGSIKFMLRVTKYLAKGESEVVFEDAYGLSLNETRQIPDTEWSISLENVSEEAASLRIYGSNFN
ncbi:MAG: hypothetical protein AB2601_18225 [Candidatus Thiodiazotropha sp.]